MSLPRFVSPTLVSVVSVTAFWASSLAGCGKSPEKASGPGAAAMGSSVPQSAAGQGRPSTARPDPRTPGAMAGSGVGGSTGVKGLQGLWGLVRVEVGGMSVPLPKHFRIRLHFLPGGKLVVHGVKRTKAQRSEGTWRVKGDRLVSTVDGKREIRRFVLDGDQLTLTRKLLRVNVWKMKRLVLPNK